MITVPVVYGKQRIPHSNNPDILICILFWFMPIPYFSSDTVGIGAILELYITPLIMSSVSTSNHECIFSSEIIFSSN